ncbi:MAG: zinc ribbon domain-containing protein [Clostridium sp.]|uniref:zinc ribbon domain-containing protein n=1 Tax=Clostridium sp. TaxID=1506 RepID=UPI0029121CE8|nr:zinc ribbon domain-containing protein [Clostridium sp.]MDU7336906.1 zinc ribbon domain-containing protein [Clostridium sp.]
MYCKNCGNQITDDSKFCFNCGTPIEITKPEEVETQKPDDLVDPVINEGKEEKGCTSSLFFLFFTPFLICIGIALLVNIITAIITPDSTIPANQANASSNSIPSSTSLNSAATSSQMSEEKAYAIQFDEFIMNTILGSNEALEDLDNYINAYSENKISALEAYEAAKNTKELMNTLNKTIWDIRNSKTGAYIGVAQEFLINGKFKAENMMKYLDKNEVKYLSEMKQNDLNIYNSFKKLMLQRISYLQSQGFSDTEINEIIQKTPSSTSSK